MNITKMSLGPLGTNCYLVSNETDAIIFDPGGDSYKIINYLEKVKLNPKAILLTHGHFDHIGAVDHVREYFNIPVYIHKREAEWLEDPNLNGSALFPVGQITAKSPDYLLDVGNMTIGDMQFEIRHTPGHSPGGVVFIFHGDGHIIGGDSLFQSGIGRTDLPGGNHQQLLNSIRKQLFTLKDSFVVHPGHGEDTTIKEEQEHNPFLT
ncbi:MBL fold metallo-hydrolase [Aquibacillus saliphilus]|uniref:MBL fold metallo-hydrolase n=1 Tax=Aquibacillus saliphilus TaxID=1909422 RepID=UPI001CEFE71E|nr:MBL fold metallo-hydrolase [Aquibacillus saliphilus]